MTNYLVFLRAVNVSGKNSIKMQLLKEAFTHKKLLNTKTYIQSGNIFIPNYKQSSAALKTQIEGLLFTEFNIETICIVKTIKQLRTLIYEIPFSIENTKQLYFTFTDKHPSKEDVNAIIDGDYKGDQFSISNETIYIQCINGFGKTKLNNNFFEKKLKLKATTRNWNTILKMIALAEEQDSRIN